MMTTRGLRVLRAAITVGALALLLPALPTAGAAQERAATAEAVAARPVEFLWETQGGPEPLVGPVDVAVDAEGTLWAVDSGSSRFQLFAPDGTYLETWGTPGSGDGAFNFRVDPDDPHHGIGSVAFGPDGSIYVADTSNYRVQRFDRDRTYLTQWGVAGARDGQFLSPMSIAVDGDGNVYVSDDGRDDIQKFDADGRFLLRFGGPGSGEGKLFNTGYLTIDSQDTVWIADYGNNRVQQFSRDGAFLQGWGSRGTGDGELSAPIDVAVAPDGTVYVADTGNSRIQVFTRDGQYLGQWGSAGTDAGQFTALGGLALTDEGILYAADSGADRVQKFALPASPAAAQTTEVTEEVWIETTVPAGVLPDNRPATLLLFRIAWDAGTGYRYQEAVPGIGVNCVLAGQWAFRPDADEQVARTAARLALTDAPAREEATLGAGDCALLHQDVARDERNAGTEPVEFLALALIPDGTPPPANSPEALSVDPLGYLYRGNWSRTPHAPAGPFQLSLRRITLAPGAALPAQQQNGDALLMLTDGELGMTALGGRPLVERAVSFQSAAPLPIDEDSETILQAGDSVHIQEGTTVTLRSPGAAPATWWQVTVTPLAGEAAAATPAAPAPATDVASPAADALEFLWASTGGPEPLDSPYGMAVAPDGALWVADGNNSRFQILSPDGTYRETWGSQGSGDGEFDFTTTFMSTPTGYGDIAFAADGSFYVADSGNRRVQKFGPGREFLLTWGEEGKGDGQFLTPSSIAVDAQGVIYVGDEKRGDVQRFDGEGRFLGTIGRPGMAEGEFGVPSGLAIDGAGNLWVSDWTLHRVQRFSPDGELLAVWGSQGTRQGQLLSPNDVAVDAAGRVYIWDDSNWRIQVFTPDGQFLATIGGIGTDPGEWLSGAGLALGPDGTLYVSDMMRHDVQAFRIVLPERDA